MKNKQSQIKTFKETKNMSDTKSPIKEYGGLNNLKRGCVEQILMLIGGHATQRWGRRFRLRLNCRYPRTLNNDSFLPKPLKNRFA